MGDRFDRERQQRQRAAQVGVAFECRVCGRPVLLVAESGTIVVPNRDLFLRMHGQCLKEQRRARRDAD